MESTVQLQELKQFVDIFLIDFHSISSTVGNDVYLKVSFFLRKDLIDSTQKNFIECRCFRSNRVPLLAASKTFRHSVAEYVVQHI